MAIGALSGGLDHLPGNRLGLGNRFEEAFHLLGSIALSMAGIICLAPVLSPWLGKIIVPVFGLLRLDPGMFGSILAIDMGGYQMAMDLCKDPLIGRYAGIIVSAIFGCTIVFTIPVGLGAVNAEDRPFFTKGILFGLIAMPVGLIAGGLLIGMVSVVPALAMIPRMDQRGKVVCGAFVVSSASLFAAHLGFTISVEPELVTGLIAAKLLGGITGIILALFLTKNVNTKS